MNIVAHAVKLQYQPTNRTCAYTSGAMLLDAIGIHADIAELASEVPEIKDREGNVRGGIAQEVAIECLERGATVDLYSFDCQIVDLSWQQFSNDEIIARLRAVRQNRDMPNLGKQLTERYVDAYIHFLEKAGNLHIMPCVTSDFLCKLLDDGPIFVNACPHIMFNEGRLLYPELRKSKLDDANGEVSIHSLVVHGYDDENFLLSDPFYGPQSVKKEQLTGAIMAAAIGCDSLCFQITA